MQKIMEMLQWHVVGLVLKPALIALLVALVDVGLLDAAIYRHVAALFQEAAVEAVEPK